jgi:hypothetical protein
VPLDDLQRKAAHVFDQHDAKGDCNGPKLADHQRLDLLVGLDKSGEDPPGHQAVGVGNIGPSQAKHPWIARERTFGELWKLPVIAGRKVVMNLAKLLFHKVEVVQQPLRRRSDHLAGLQASAQVR